VSSLATEAQSARSVLTAADVDVQLELHCGDLPPPVLSVLAAVLREGVTNVLRHSRAKSCEISINETDGTVRLEIVNDGVHASTEPWTGGSGIKNLADRISALGGTVTAGLDQDGRYRLQASAPVAIGAGSNA
jgi:signal transduction histidine kinase